MTTQSERDARRQLERTLLWEEAQRRFGVGAPSAFNEGIGGRREALAAVAPTEAATAFSPADVESARQGYASRKRLADQTREEAYDPVADMFDPRNMFPVGRGGQFDNYQTPPVAPAPTSTPVTKLTSAPQIARRVTEQQLRPTPVASPEAGWPQPSPYPALPPDPDLPFLPRALPEGGMRLPSQEAAGPQVPFDPRDVTSIYDLPDNYRPAYRPGDLTRPLTVPPPPAIGGRTFGGRTFGGNTYGGQTYGASSEGRDVADEMRTSYAEANDAVRRALARLPGSAMSNFRGMPERQVAGYAGGGGVLHDILGFGGQLLGNLIPIPIVGPAIGKFLGHTAGNLIEGNPGNIDDDLGRDAMSAIPGIGGSMMGGGGGGFGSMFGGFAAGGPTSQRGGYPELYTQPVRRAFSTGGGDRYVKPDGRGNGRSDHIEAVLSPGEYVFDAETTALLGDGDNEAGARKLDKLRQNVRRDKGKALAKGKISPDAKKSADAYMPKLSASDRLAHGGMSDGFRQHGRR